MNTRHYKLLKKLKEFNDYEDLSEVHIDIIFEQIDSDYLTDDDLESFANHTLTLPELIYILKIYDQRLFDSGFKVCHIFDTE